MVYCKLYYEGLDCGIEKHSSNAMRDRMHLCKSIRTNRVVWYTNMASPKSCENAFKDITSQVILEFGQSWYIWFYKINVVYCKLYSAGLTWIAELKNIHQMQGEIMHLCKSICAKRVVWYTNMASEKSCENAFKDISNSEFGAVSFIKQETKGKTKSPE